MRKDLRELERGSPDQVRGLRSNASRYRSLRDLACFVSLSFAGLVVLARSMNPIPSRTRPLNSSAPMVLWLKPWESRSLPGLPRTRPLLFTCHDSKRRLPFGRRRFFFASYGGWPAGAAEESACTALTHGQTGEQMLPSWAVHFTVRT